MAMYLSILTVVLLALVAGLLLMLHMQLRHWREAARQAPLLAETLTEGMLTARRGLSEMKQELVKLGPDLSRLIDEGGKARVELQFVLQRAEQLAAKLDKPAKPGTEDDLPMVRLAPETQAVVERVAGANTLANTLTNSPVVRPQKHASAGQDPLEELLANLQTVESDKATEKPAKRKRSGPITQAELDLQQSLKGLGR